MIPAKIKNLQMKLKKTPDMGQQMIAMTLILKRLVATVQQQVIRNVIVLAER